MLNKIFNLFFSLKGRISRTDFILGTALFFVLFIISIQIYIRVVLTMMMNIENLQDIILFMGIGFIFVFCITYIFSAICVKRLHDLGASGKKLLSFNPFAKIELMKRCFKEDGIGEDNVYGNSISIFPELMRKKLKIFTIGFIVLGIFIHIVGIRGLMSGILQDSPLVEIANSEIKNNPEIIDHFGKNAIITGVRSFSSSETNISGNAFFRVSVSGETNKGEIDISMVKNGETWKVQNIAY